MRKHFQQAFSYLSCLYVRQCHSIWVSCGEVNRRQNVSISFLGSGCYGSDNVYSHSLKRHLYNGHMSQRCPRNPVPRCGSLAGIARLDKPFDVSLNSRLVKFLEDPLGCLLVALMSSHYPLVRKPNRPSALVRHYKPLVTLVVRQLVRPIRPFAVHTLDC